MRRYLRNFRKIETKQKTMNDNIVKIILFSLFLFSCNDFSDHDSNYKMTYKQGNNQVVISAPHGGYEIDTEKMVEKIAKALNFGFVIAKGYRNPRKQKWINVNRPTESFYSYSKRLKSKKTQRARKIFEKYINYVKKASKKGNIELLIELHGNNRKIKLAQKTIPLNVIELAHTNLSKSDLKKFKQIYMKSVKKFTPAVYIPLYIDALDNIYYYKNKKVAFKWKATQTKKIGILQKKYAKKSLHFELPKEMRRNKQLQNKYCQIFIYTLGKFISYLRWN